MTHSVYIDEGKSLVFPTMCDGFIRIEYTNHNRNNPVGLWGING